MTGANPLQVDEFSTARARIFRLPLEVFPRFWAYAYLVLAGDMQALIDVGSGFGESNQHLEAGLQAVSERTGSQVGLDTLTHVFISHGHIDHFGGLTYVRPRTSAQIGVHELDRRILTNYEERIAVVMLRLGSYLAETGMPAEEQARLLDLYQLNKSLFHSVPIDFTYEQTGMQVGPFEFMHVPGHCSGQVVIRLEDVLFAGDFVLNRTTPHMAPESLTLNTGLSHYLESLHKIEAWVPQIRLSLPGHEEPIEALSGRIQAIRGHHHERLEKTLELLQQPGTISQVSSGLFGSPDGYNGLLAIEEAGAHVEYLYTRGQVGIANMDEVEQLNGPVALRYQAL